MYFISHRDSVFDNVRSVLTGTNRDGYRCKRMLNFPCNFRNGVSSRYTGGRSPEDIVKWLEKKTRPPVVHLGGVESVLQFVNANEVVVVGLFKV